MNKRNIVIPVVNRSGVKRHSDFMNSFVWINRRINKVSNAIKIDGIRYRNGYTNVVVNANKKSLELKTSIRIVVNIKCSRRTIK